MNDIATIRGHAQSLTTASPADGLNPSAPEDGRLPEFTRLPAVGKRCPYTGLTRTALNDLILGARPKVKSVVLRKKGAARGVRLIHLTSLLEYLHTEMRLQLEQQSPEGGKHNA